MSQSLATQAVTNHFSNQTRPSAAKQQLNPIRQRKARCCEAAPPYLSRHCQSRWQPIFRLISIRKVSYSNSTTSTAAARTDANQSRSDDATESEVSESKGNVFQNLVGNLLTGAASRLERGTTTCRACRGTGTCSCTACKGHGVLPMAKLQMKTGGRKSNRCSKCGGSGLAPCPTCKGRGFRGDFET